MSNALSFLSQPQGSPPRPAAAGTDLEFSSSAYAQARAAVAAAVDAASPARCDSGGGGSAFQEVLSALSAAATAINARHRAAVADCERIIESARAIQQDVEQSDGAMAAALRRSDVRG